MQVIKRNGNLADLDSSKIAIAISKAYKVVRHTDLDNFKANRLAQEALNLCKHDKNNCYTIEDIQDGVEKILMVDDMFDVGKAYILYREKHKELRQQNRVTEELQILADKSSKFFDFDPLREFVFSRTYAKWILKKERRELWSETVDRYMKFIISRCGDKIQIGIYQKIQEALLNMEVMPSMRLLQFAGPAADRCNVCVYNCAFSAPESFKDLADIMYLSMSGTGVGFSVEKHNVDKFPEFSIPPASPICNFFTIEDSKEGWCNSLIECLAAEFNGWTITFDYSKLRPKGARLMTSGGRSSGPDPLKELHHFIRKTIKVRREAEKTRLSTLNVHDIICKIGQIVVAGGVRRCIAKGQKVNVMEITTEYHHYTGEEMHTPWFDYKEIQQINIGDLVQTISGWKKVKAFVEQGVQKVIKIVHSGGSEPLICTPNHRIAVFNNPDDSKDFIWKNADDLTTNDLLGFPTDKGSISLVHIREIQDAGEAETYDIEVEDNHNFVCSGVLVHNSALISISDLDDQEMRDCKNGPIWVNNSQRYLANNSAAYNVKPSQIQFMKEWIALAESGTGERGIINRSGLKRVLPKRRVDFLGDKINHVGMNPCSEIILQPFQFCNLSEVVCRPDDTKESLSRKVYIATVMGTIQSSLSDFKYIEDKWKKNQDDERLLGVSLTGIMDCPIINDPKILEYLKNQAIACNQEYASFLNINPSNAITCVKPSGSVSQMVNSSSGIHPRFAPYYIRRVRISNDDPLLKMMISQGYKTYPAPEAQNTSVLEFPVKSPDNAITVNDTDTIQQLKNWQLFKKYWTEHNPSVTVYVKPDEWLETGKWVWDNWDDVLGISFFPKSDHVYEMAPYEAITKEEYETRLKSLKKVNFAELVNFELEDTTEVKKEVACAGGVCEL